MPQATKPGQIPQFNMSDSETSNQTVQETETAVHPTSGSVHRVWLLAYPIILANMSETLLGVVDTYMVGQLGVAEIGAVGLGTMLAWLFYLPILGLAMGVNTFVAQSYGAGNRKACGYMTWQGLYLALISGAMILLVIPLAPFLFDLAGPSVEVRRLGVTYLQWRLIDGPAFMIAMTVASFFRGIGDTKTPMKVGIAINIINIILNYGLIYGNFGLPRLEVQGSAIGSALAGMLGGGIYLVLFLSRRLRPYATRTVVGPSRRDFLRLIRVGAPIGLQRFLDIGSFVIFSAVIGRLGNAQLAANQIAIQLMSISYMIGLGIGMAASTLVGQYIGARRLELAERSAYSALKLAMGIMVFIGLVFLVFPEPLITLFNSDPDVIRYGRTGLLYAALFQAFDALAVIFIGALRGAGDTRWSAVAAFIGAWLIFLPMTYLLTFTLGLEFWGAWLSASIYICLLGLACVYRFRQGVWKTMII